jgi:hypothetical protein
MDVLWAGRYLNLNIYHYLRVHLHKRAFLQFIHQPRDAYFDE